MQCDVSCQYMPILGFFIRVLEGLKPLFKQGILGVHAQVYATFKIKKNKLNNNCMIENEFE